MNERKSRGSTERARPHTPAIMYFKYFLLSSTYCKGKRLWRHEDNDIIHSPLYILFRPLSQGYYLESRRPVTLAPFFSARVLLLVFCWVSFCLVNFKDHMHSRGAVCWYFEIQTRQHFEIFFFTFFLGLVFEAIFFWSSKLFGLGREMKTLH